MVGDMHEINTRLANSLIVVLLEYQTQMYKRSFIYRASVAWNLLPESLKNCDTNHANDSFKTGAKFYFHDFMLLFILILVFNGPLAKTVFIPKCFTHVKYFQNKKCNRTQQSTFYV